MIGDFDFSVVDSSAEGIGHLNAVHSAASELGKANHRQYAVPIRIRCAMRDLSRNEIVVNRGVFVFEAGRHRGILNGVSKVNDGKQDVAKSGERRRRGDATR